MSTKSHPDWLRNSLFTIQQCPDRLPFNSWRYEDSILWKALLEAASLAEAPSIPVPLKEFLSQFLDADGLLPILAENKKSVDLLCTTKLVLAQYKRTHDPMLTKTLRQIWETIQIHPRLYDGHGFAHKEIYPHQLWLDGTYMLLPLYAELTDLYLQLQGSNLWHPTEEECQKAWDEIAEQFELVNQYCYEEAKGLYVHAFDYSRTAFWCEKANGRSSQIWGRAMGWLAMAVVDTLEYFPINHPGRKNLILTVKRLASGIRKSRTQSGVWYQILDCPNAPGNYPESSVSAMFCYFLKKASAAGLLKDDYKAEARAALDSLLSTFVSLDASGFVHIRNVCLVAGLGPKNRPERDGSYQYYLSEPVVCDDNKAFGPFLQTLILFAKEETKRNDPS